MLSVVPQPEACCCIVFIKVDSLVSVSSCIYRQLAGQFSFCFILYLQTTSRTDRVRTHCGVGDRHSWKLLQLYVSMLHMSLFCDDNRGVFKVKDVDLV